MDNTIVYLLDGQFRPAKAGDVGELFVSGLNLAAGYVNGRDPEKFVDNPLAIDPTYAKLYRTGDFARVEKGVLVYEGRTDSQVKVRGHRVDLAEVEKAVNSLEGVSFFFSLMEKTEQSCYLKFLCDGYFEQDRSKKIIKKNILRIKKGWKL